MSKYGFISGSYFPVFGLNTERYDFSVFSPNTRKYGPETTTYLDTFHAMNGSVNNVNKGRLRSGSHLLKNLFYLLQCKPFKNDEKYFLFHLKSYFRSHKYLSWLLGHVEKIAWSERCGYFQTWLTNNYNTYIVQYLTK